MFKFYFILCLSFLLLGCQLASELLENNIHPKTHNYTTSNKLVENCHFDKVLEILSNNKNELLKNSEEGLVYYYIDNISQSNSHLDKAISLYRQNEDKALFDISTFLSQEYQGEGYDKVFLHNYKAINYLLLGDAESARVEARNSNLVQEKERKKLHNFKRKNKKNSKENYLLSRYEKLFQSVNPQHNPYGNPFAYYISALSYIEDNDYANALIDIRHAITLLPDSEILQKKLEQYRLKKDQKFVELFFDIGESPVKRQVRLEMKLNNDEKRMVYLPAFSLTKSAVEYIELLDSKQNILQRSSLLSDVNAIKINEFKEKLPHMLTIISEKMGVLLASQALQNQSSNLLSTLFHIGTTLYGQTDVATWSLLPEKILVISFLPQEDEEYTLILYSKEAKVLEKYRLSDLGEKYYKHFSIRGEKICQEWQ